jgi:tetratricopeptide (TPR) repeat protein
VLYRLGRLDEAWEWTLRSEKNTAPEDFLSAAMWCSTRAKVLASRGEEEEEALRLSAEAVDWIHRSDGPPFIGDTLFASGEVLRLLDRPDEARAAYEEALAVYQRKGIVPSIERTRRRLAEL